MDICLPATSKNGAPATGAVHTNAHRWCLRTDSERPMPMPPAANYQLIRILWAPGLLALFTSATRDCRGVPGMLSFPLPDCSWGLPFACLLGIWRWHDTCPVFLWICLSFSSSFTDVFLQLEWTHVGLCTMDSLIYSLTCLLFMESLVTSLASVSLYSWHYLCADVIETFHFASF